MTFSRFSLTVFKVSRSPAAVLDELGDFYVEHVVVAVVGVDEGLLGFCADGECVEEFDELALAEPLPEVEQGGVGLGVAEPERVAKKPGGAVPTDACRHADWRVRMFSL